MTQPSSKKMISKNNNIFKETERARHTEPDKQSHRQTEPQTDRATDRQTVRDVEMHTDGLIR